MMERGTEMGDDQVTGNHATPESAGEGGARSASGTSAPDWSDITRQLEELGASVASYIRATMDDPETKRHAAEVRAQLDRAAGAVGDAMSEAARSDAGQKVYNAATTVAGAAMARGQKVAEEVRPHLADAIRKANEAVRAAADSMTSRGDSAAEARGADSSDAPAPADSGSAAGAPGKSGQ